MLPTNRYRYLLFSPLNSLNSPIFSTKRRKEKQFLLLVILIYILSAYNFDLSPQTNPWLPDANWVGHSIITQELTEATIEQDG